jgi:PHP family Zn ribbon phosphoesterase
MLSLLVDLHIHTVLSPCAEVEMIPPLIVRRAQELGLGMIAIVDHNCAANAQAVIEAAKGTGIAVLPGMEVQTREEVHLLCLFDTLEQAEAWQETVWSALPDQRNREAYFGAQYVVDATGDHLYTEDRLLSASASLSVEQVVAGANALGGICLPAHVDRPSFSILSNLGFIPPGLPIAGIELSRMALISTRFVDSGEDRTKFVQFTPKEGRFSSVPSDQESQPMAGIPRLTMPRKFVELLPGLSQYGVIVNSDAHRLAEIGAYSRVLVAAPTVSELRLALSRRQDRRVDLVSPQE